MRKQITSYWASIFLILLFVASCFAYPVKQAILLNITGTIGPATSGYVQRGLDYAAAQNASVVILRLDTPGGLESSMQDITKAILSSAIPVVAYVAPTGARAASAGTFILYASAIAAMAPGTTVGDASPVHLEPTLTPPPNTSVKESIYQKNLTELEKDAINKASTYIGSLAKLRGRNQDWAEKAVMEAANISATDALKLNVIDVIANNIPDLLKQINGRSIKINDTQQTLNTDHLIIKEFKPDWRYQFLSFITNPNIAYILLLIGIYALFFEFYHPGLIVPGVAGIISLLLAIYAFQLLPINQIGFALLLLGSVFMAFEVFISSFGILGIAGIIAFVMGSILLLDINTPGYQIPWLLIVMMSIISLTFFVLVMILTVSTARRKNKKTRTHLNQEK